MQITKITDNFAVSPQIEFGDVAKIKSQGFTAIINNRPDGEAADQPLSQALAKAAKKAGIDYHHIPVRPGRASADDKARFKQVLESTEGPVLAFCRTGTRARLLHKSAMGGGGFFARLFGR
ncbi:MAG TPA: TIGR01244 family phosphatase [Hellea balneolensis]|uniref:TIGR01244 family phosphatase n=1 Tax=Hellea balneolensis TaxID=287478 RepID=A0A7C5LZH0_9PROT|nr:TIGR01244 family phosphatase [Hellea balneolensis]